jgi:hypothetical protein
MSIVTGKGLLVRPLVAHIAQLRNQAAFGKAKGKFAHIVPGFPHELEQPGDVPIADRLVRQLRVINKAPDRCHAHSPSLDLVLHLALDERRQPLAEQLHRFANAFVVRDGHGFTL